jgi:cell wall-associated NlpC family hydrolase
MNVEGIALTVPVFEEYEPTLDRPCEGCAAQGRERVRGMPARTSGPGARRALALATAVAIVWGGGATAVAAPGALATGAAAASARTVKPAARTDPDPNTPQGGSGPLHGGTGGGPSASSLRKTTRAEIINRAKRWVDEKVPYSQTSFWSDGYRQDCSGYVSMAWNLEKNEWTGSLAQFGVKIAREDLQPGDILLFHNPTDPSKGSHVTIFGGWSDFTHTYYMAYEQTPPSTIKRSTPMAYWTNSSKYVPYRYKGLTNSAGDAEATAKGFPGARHFGPGAVDRYVTRLGEMLSARGGKRFYQNGPGPRWSRADKRATRAFQRAQGWRGAEADGLPGPDTWGYLTKGLGKDIPRAERGRTPAGAPAHRPGAAADSFSEKAPPFPGADHFGPGRSNVYVERLAEQLVKKGFGVSRRNGPSRSWSEWDRRSVAAFQRAQGWTGDAADGYPGPETWRRLFA